MTDARERLTQFLMSATSGRPLSPSSVLELDSLVLLQLVNWLESEYGIRLADHDIGLEDLESIDSILSLIARYRLIKLPAEPPGNGV